MSPRVLFEQELKQLQKKVAEMGKRAVDGYECLTAAVTGQDIETLERILQNDRHMIDRMRTIEAMCLTLLTRQQPIAGDLRIVSASLKVVSDIERVGDHVLDMAELFLRLEPVCDISAREPQLAAMMKETGEMLRAAVSAFVEGNIEAARKVIAWDDVVDHYFNTIKGELIRTIRTGQPDADMTVDILMIAKYLEKIGDHAVNIGEWTVFRRTGDIEQVRIL